MSKFKTISKEDEKITCVGNRTKYHDCTEATIKCYRAECYFCYSKRGDHWTQDIIECQCPVDINPGETWEVKKRFMMKKLGGKNGNKKI